MPAPSRFPADFGVSAAYLLFDYDPQQDRGWVLHFTPQDYRRASFLDERALGHRQVPGWTLDRSELPGLLPDSSVLPTLHWLFHIGHCGSTLTSRLLDLVPGVLGLREPLPLLRLAGNPPAAHSPWFAPVLRMLARRFPDTQAVVVKPTSLVTASARSLLDHSAGRACLLWVDLQTWLASVCATRGCVRRSLPPSIPAARRLRSHMRWSPNPSAWRGSGSRNNFAGACWQPSWMTRNA